MFYLEFVKNGKTIRRTFKTVSGWDRAVLTAEFDKSIEILGYGETSS
jgi:hypothetical protein